MVTFKEYLKEAKYVGKNQEAVDFLRAVIDDEEENDEEESEDVIRVLWRAIRALEAGKFTEDDLEKFGMDIYNATAGDGMYGDTDYADNIQLTLKGFLL